MPIREASTRGGRGVGGRRCKMGLKLANEAFCNPQSAYTHQREYKRRDKVRIMENLKDITRKLATRVHVRRNSFCTAFRQIYFQHQIKGKKIESEGTLKIMGSLKNHKPMIPGMRTIFKSIELTTHSMKSNRQLLCLKSSRECRSFDTPREEDGRKTSFPGSYSHEPSLYIQNKQSQETEVTDTRNNETSIESTSPYTKNLMIPNKQHLLASNTFTTIRNNDIDKSMIPPRPDNNLSREISMTVSCTTDTSNTIQQPKCSNRQTEQLHNQLKNISLMSCVCKRKQHNNMKKDHLSSASLKFDLVNMSNERTKNPFSRLKLNLDQMGKNCSVIREQKQSKNLRDKIGLNKIPMTSVYFRWMDDRYIKFFGNAVT